MSTSLASRTSFRFPGHPAPVPRRAGLSPWSDAARPLPQAADMPAVCAGKELFEEVIANIQGIIQGDRPVRAAW